MAVRRYAEPDDAQRQFGNIRHAYCGRVIAPRPIGKVSNVTFGGAEFDTLYATCGDKVYRRKVKVKGAPSFKAPVKPVPPRL